MFDNHSKNLVFSSLKINKNIFFPIQTFVHSHFPYCSNFIDFEVSKKFRKVLEKNIRGDGWFFIFIEIFSIKVSFENLLSPSLLYWWWNFKLIELSSTEISKLSSDGYFWNIRFFDTDEVWPNLKLKVSDTIE